MQRIQLRFRTRYLYQTASTLLHRADDGSGNRALRKRNRLSDLGHEAAAVRAQGDGPFKCTPTIGHRKAWQRRPLSRVSSSQPAFLVGRDVLPGQGQDTGEYGSEEEPAQVLKRRLEQT